MKDDKSESNSTTSTKTFKENCIQTLCNITLITTLVDRLSNAGCLEDFVKLVKQFSDGTVSAMNIAFLLCQDVARFHSCVTSTVMHFRKETKHFWEVVYRICKGKDLRLSSGSKNRGSVQNKSACSGNYCLKDSSVNFVVPDEKSLVKNCCNLSKLILPGIIDSAIKLLDKSKKYVLSIDGKK